MSDAVQPRSEENLRHEYTEILETYRHHSNLRVATFSVFIAIMAGMSLVAFGNDQFGQNAATISRVTGILVILIFWTYEERLTSLVQYFLRTAAKLEQPLGYTLCSGRPIGRKHLPNREIIMRAFFAALALLWTYAAITVPLDGP